MRRHELNQLPLERLVERAREVGVDDASRMQKDELIDALLKRAASQRRIDTMKTWFGVARDLVASVVDRGLHLPEAAQMLRGTPKPPTRKPPPPLPTVTLAEIYAAQGYYAKAVAVLDDVLTRDAGHAVAGPLRAKYLAELSPEERSHLERRAAAARPQPGGTAPESVSPESVSPESVSPESVSPDSASRGPVSPESAPKAKAAATEAAEPAAALADPILLDDVAETSRSAITVDELVALATDPRTAYVYWEITPLRFARARRSDPEGKLVLRVLSVTAGPEGAESSSRDLQLDPLVGDRFVRGLTPGSEVRLCLGWAGPKGFLPLVVAPEMSMPRDYRAELPVTLWLDPREVRRSFGRADSASSPSAAAAAVRHQQRYLAQVASSPRAAILDFASAPFSRAQLRSVPRAAGSLGVGGASDLLLGGASEILMGGASDLVQKS